MTENTQLTEAIQALVQALAPEPETPAATPTGTYRRNAAGRLVDEKGKFVPEGKAMSPAKATKPAKKATKAAPKGKAKAQEPKAEVTYVRKATRAATIAAIKANGGPDLTGLGTKALVREIIEQDIDLPAPYVIGDGYRAVIAQEDES